MHKLIILIDASVDSNKFDDEWPKFLRLAEAMPGLVRETSSWVDGVIFGSCRAKFIHELYFESKEALDLAMKSSQGVAAGRLLQWITEGHVTLMFAQHQEEVLENLKRQRSDENES